MGAQAQRSRTGPATSPWVRWSPWVLLLAGVAITVLSTPIVDLVYTRDPALFERLTGRERIGGSTARDLAILHDHARKLLLPVAAASVLAGVLLLRGSSVARVLWQWSAGRTQQLVLGVLVAGILLRLRVLTSGRSVWLDEASLLINVRDRPLLELLSEPLAYYQSAPPGFLALTRGAFVSLGVSDLSGRIVPFVAAIASLLVAVVVARRLLATGAAQVVFVALLAGSPVLIYYASEAKQYSSDVLASLLVLLLWSWKDEPQRRLAAATIGTAIAVTSLPGLLLLGLLVLAVLLQPSVVAASPEPARVAIAPSSPASTAGDAMAPVGLAAVGSRIAAHRRWFPVLVPWALGGAAHLAHQVMAGADRDRMISYWEAAGAFPPTPLSLDGILWWPASVAHLAWLGVGTWGPTAPTLLSISSSVLTVPATILLLAVAVVTVRRRHPAALLPALMVGAALLITVPRLYPFSGRLILYLLPAVFLLIATAVDTLAGSVSVGVKRTWTHAGLLLLAAVLAQQWTSAILYATDPADRSDMRSTLEQVGAAAEPEDVLLVDRISTGRVLDWYAPLTPELDLPRGNYDWRAGGPAGLRRAIAGGVQPVPAGDSWYWLVLGHRMQAAPRILETAARDLEAQCVSMTRDTLVALLRQPAGASGSPDATTRDLPECW